jgi:hypothetical protein
MILPLKKWQENTTYCYKDKGWEEKPASDKNA